MTDEHTEGLREAVAAEREACAKVADTFANLKRDNPGGIIAAAIRNRPPIAAGGEVERLREALVGTLHEAEWMIEEVKINDGARQAVRDRLARARTVLAEGCDHDAG